MGSLAKKAKKGVKSAFETVTFGITKDQSPDKPRGPGVFTQRTPDAPSQTRDRRRRPMQMMGSIVEDPLGG